MFFRQKRSGDHVYIQIVENRWEKGGSKQRVIATVGRLDQLRESGQLDGLLQSGAKFAESVMVLATHRQGKTPSMRINGVPRPSIFAPKAIRKLPRLTISGSTAARWMTVLPRASVAVPVTVGP